jgi:hypothetical protein
MMPIPGGELVISLAVQAIIGLAVWAVKLAWRGVRSAVFEHPILTLLILKAIRDLGWWVPLFGTSFDLFMLQYEPLIALGLTCIGIARFVAGGGPAAVARDSRRAGRWVRDTATAIAAAEWALDRRDEGDGKRRRIFTRGHTKDGPDASASPLPPPPEPIPMGPAGGADVIDVHEVPPVNGHGTPSPKSTEPMGVTA